MSTARAQTWIARSGDKRINHEKSQLAHMRLGYHFISNLHITETRSILFLPKSDKNNIIGWAEAHSKTGFSVNDWKSSKTLRRLKRNSRCTLISGWDELFSSVQVSAVPKLIVFLYSKSDILQRNVCLFDFFLVSISSHANEQIKDCQVVKSRNATSSQETCVVKIA